MPPPKEPSDSTPGSSFLWPVVLAIAAFAAISNGVFVLSERETVYAPEATNSFTYEDALSNLGTDGGVLPPYSEPLPTTPKSWQDTGTCKRGEHKINGACYMRWASEDMLPPCDSGSVEHKGRCYRAIRKVERPDTSTLP